MASPTNFYYPGDNFSMGYFSPIFASPYGQPARAIHQDNYIPMNMIQENGEEVTITYKGDLRNPNNHSAPIPKSMSTSVFISELPSSCTIHDVLNEIRGCGKIWASNLIPPQQNYATAAAKVVFWNREGLERFLQRWADGNFIVGGRQPKVVMNDYHSAPKGDSPSSRVLRIAGPSHIVNETYLRDFFRDKFTFEVDEVIVLLNEPYVNENTVEFRFSSYRAQASAAWKWLQAACRGELVQNPNGGHWSPFTWVDVRFAWGDDPCAM
ncbi:hypothetical protein F4810DRAFT_694145 [Camillea tinctor]|nr:hypothetical protein F4810DRAFT_694145 [Camillea tinctor]